MDRTPRRELSVVFALSEASQFNARILAAVESRVSGPFCGN
jgi:hypothetical protein